MAPVLQRVGCSRRCRSLTFIVSRLGRVESRALTSARITAPATMMCFMTEVPLKESKNSGVKLHHALILNAWAQPKFLVRLKRAGGNKSWHSDLRPAHFSSLRKTMSTVRVWIDTSCRR